MKFSNSADKIIVSPVEYMFTKLKYVSQASKYKENIKALDSSPQRLSMASLWQGDIRLGIGLLYLLVIYNKVFQCDNYIQQNIIVT